MTATSLRCGARHRPGSGPRPRGGWAALAVVAIVIAAVAGTSTRDPAAAQPAPTITITASSWEAKARGSWSAFAVRVANQGPDDFTGELVLVPQLPDAGQGPETGAGAVPNAAPVRYRTPVAIDQGGQRAFTVPLVAAPGSYRAEVRDGSGRVAAAGEVQTLAPTGDDWVGLLTDVATNRAFFPAAPSRPFRLSSRFASAADFPTNAVMLRGLRAVAMVDFDSATLRPAQVDALRAFVGLGGGLLLAGGTGAARTTASLPDDLVPLRPTKSRSASLAPLADLAGRTSGATTTVSVGDIRDGRTVLEGADGVPLVVERSYGAGRIVQLAYDPIAEVTRLGSLAQLARDYGLVRAGVGADTSSISDSDPQQGDEAEALVSRLEAKSASRPPLALLALLLLAYASIVGPLAYRRLRAGGGPELQWAAAPLLALVLAGATWVALRPPWRSPFVDHQVQVQRSGAGATQIDTYHLIDGRQSAGLRLRLDPATTAAVAAVPPPPRRLPEVLRAVGLARKGPTPPRSTRPDEVRSGKTSRLTLAARPARSSRMLRTSSVAIDDTGLVARLRIEAGRLEGTVTNTSRQPVRHLRAWASDGTRAEVADTLAPGATVEVDAALERPGASDTQSEVAFGAMAELAGTGSVLQPGQVGLAATVSPRGDGSFDGIRPKGSVEAVMVTTTRLERADALGAGLDRARLVCACSVFGDKVAVYEVTIPPGVNGPLGLSLALDPKPVLGAPPPSVDVYDRSSGSWRTLPPAMGGAGALEPGEIEGGVVTARVRDLGLGAALRLVAAA